jgi:uncharacterized protein (TIGR02246 family)
MIYKVLLPGVLLLLSGALSIADDVPNDDVQQIEAEVAAYLEAFNAKDAAALAQHWSENGVYVRPADGERLVGRKAIEKEFQTTFATQPEAVLTVKVDTIRFITSDVAIEDGTAEVTFLPDTPPSRTGYSAVHIKRDGQWQVDSIRETELPSREESAGGRLHELAWLVGDWVDRSDEATVETSVVWTKNKTFLSYTFKISAGNVDELEGTQVVGYDPVAKNIRSWMFDSDAGFGEGVWSREDNRWLVKFRQTLADGRMASSTNVYTLVDANTFTWQAVDREVDGEPLPNVEPVTLVRKPALASSIGKRK